MPSDAGLEPAVDSSDVPASDTRSIRERPDVPRAARRSLSLWLLALMGVGMWLGLVTWRLDSVPGMSLDEAWSILAARGQWRPANPLSGMTSYSGPFPVLLLRLLGTDDGVSILRGVSVAANGAALIVVGLILRRVYPARAFVSWALPLLATLPVWLVVLRTGIEVVMFTPLLCLLGLHALLRRTPRGDFAAGFIWGLLVYNHLIGICFPIGVALGWLTTYRRLPPIATRAALFGGLLGLGPRIVAVALYNLPLEGTAAKYSLLSALGDVRWLPLCLWRTLNGDTVYLRYVGRLAIEPWPYWLLAIAFVIPWIGRSREVPKPAWFALSSALFGAVLVTLAAPYIAVRFLVLPAVGLVTFLVLLGAAAIERDAAWRLPIAGTAWALTALNLFYSINDFHRPWQSLELGITKFFLGDRSKRTGNWAYFPKQTLVRELRALTPAPEQIVTVPTLERPLRVLLDDSPVRVALPANADPTLRSVFVDYLYPDSPDPHCAGAPAGEMCFARPSPIAQFFILYTERVEPGHRVVQPAATQR